MAPDSTSGRRLAASLAAKRWGLVSGFTKVQAGQALLRLCHKAGFAYDARLIAESRLLTDTDGAPRFARRLIAQGEGNALRAYAYSQRPDLMPFQSSAVATRLETESPLSSRWYEDLLSLVDDQGRRRSGVPLCYLLSPAQRRPDVAAVAVIEDSEGWQITPSVRVRKKDNPPKEESSLEWFAGFAITSMRVVLGIVALGVGLAIATERFQRSSEQMQKFKEIKRRIDNRKVERIQQPSNAPLSPKTGIRLRMNKVNES